MYPTLAHAVLRAAREIRECADAGEHPGAALRAVRRAYSTCGALVAYGRAEPEWYERLASIVGALEDACRVYAANPEHVAEVDLPREGRRLEKLVRIAEASLKEEEIHA
jgi:hypothetical protein